MVVQIKPGDKSSRVAVHQDVFVLFSQGRNDPSILAILREQVTDIAMKMGVYGTADTQRPVTLEMFSKRAIDELVRKGCLSRKVQAEAPSVSTRARTLNSPPVLVAA